MLTDSLIEEPLLRLTQRLLREIPCDLVPKLLDKTNTVTSRQLAEGLDDLLRIHLRVTPARDGTADDPGSPPSPVIANAAYGPRRGVGAVGWMRLLGSVRVRSGDIGNNLVQGHR